MSHILNKGACDKDVNIRKLTELLPLWKTYILEAKMIDDVTSPQLHLKFLIEAHNVEEIRRWRMELQESNKSTYSIYATMRTTGKYIDFKQRLVCQHKTRHKNVHNPLQIDRCTTKNTNCPSRMTIVLHAIKARYRGKEKEKHQLLCKMPCEITFVATHNHDLRSYESLKFRKMSPEVREKLVDLFNNGQSPISALKTIQADIRVNNENYEEMLMDRRYCPTYEDCYTLYKKHCQIKSNLGNIKEDNMEYIKVLHEGFDYTVSSNLDEGSDAQDEYNLDEDDIKDESNSDEYLTKTDSNPEECFIELGSGDDEGLLQKDIDNEFIIEISNNQNDTIVQHENVVETIIVDQDITQFIADADTAKTAAQTILSKINNVVSEFIERSPEEVAVALESMYKTLKTIQDPSMFATCCSTFGSGIQPISTSRKTKLCDENTHIRDSSRKILNGKVKKPGFQHKSSKEILNALKRLKDNN